MLLKRSLLLHFHKHLSSPSIHRHLRLSSAIAATAAPPQPHNADQVSAAFKIITSSSSPESMSHSILSSSLPLSDPAFLDLVLRRARFSHANPLRTLEFFDLVEATHNHLRPSPFAYDTLLYILGRSRRFPDCWSLLLRMKRADPSLVSPRTLQTVLGRIAKVCSVRATVESFRKFKRLVRPFDTSCFNALLRTLCQEKSMSDARNVYHSLKYEFRPDLQTFNILLAGWKAAEDAESFFAEMRELGVKPDLVTYNCLIDVYCKNREVAKARQLFDEMSQEEISPDVISYTSLIGGLGLVGQPDKARDVLREMREAGCHPDAAAYNAAIRNYCIAKRMGDAFQLMEEMAARGLAPNATTYNLFFRVFYWANDLESAWRLYGRMRTERCLPNVQSCMFLVRLCKRQEKVENGVELWGDMVANGFGSLTLVSDVLFDMLCDWGRLDEVEKCFVEMVEKGQRPSRLSFRRIKVLMELANRHESVRNLSAKMVVFGGPSVDGENEMNRESDVDL